MCPLEVYANSSSPGDYTDCFLAFDGTRVKTFGDSLGTVLRGPSVTSTPPPLTTSISPESTQRKQEWERDKGKRTLCKTASFFYPSHGPDIGRSLLEGIRYHRTHLKNCMLLEGALDLQLTGTCLNFRYRFRTSGDCASKLCVWTRSFKKHPDKTCPEGGCPATKR